MTVNFCRPINSAFRPISAVNSRNVLTSWIALDCVDLGTEDAAEGAVVFNSDMAIDWLPPGGRRFYDLRGKRVASEHPTP